MSKQITSWLMLLALARPVSSQTISGSSLSHRSSGSGFGNWTLSENGYVGTYFTLAAPGEVTLTASASGSTNDAVLPRMSLVVADSDMGFDVASGFANYQYTIDLPAGTYFVRTEFNNDVPTADRQLTVGSLTITGATVSNTTSTSTNNTNALAAANTYIENYRKGPARVELVGATPGTMVHAKLKRHDFRFGTAVGGTYVGGGGGQYDVNTYLNNPNYSGFLLDHFNTITQGNAGKWAYNEETRDVNTMQAVDRFFQYAEANNLDVRVHNMLWGDSQQPAWASTLLTNAAGGNQTAKNDLRTEISERIDYYVGNNDANPNDDRARRYHEMDLLNEHDHQPKYWNVYGADGIADIFDEAAAAIAGANSNAKLYLNEYNVFSWGDAYGNWYRRDIDEIVNQGGAIGGIGIQYYPTATTNPAAIHSPARMNQILQGLSVTGLDISLTEFGVGTSSGTTLQNASTYLEDTMRLVFGTPNATTFMMWGFWANDVWNQAPRAALRDANWNPTLPGMTYDALMSEWDTDVMLPVGPDGTINFTGFYGDYEVTVGDQVFELSLTKAIEDYQFILAVPGDFDGDGDVDGRDFLVWQRGGSPTPLSADDLADWQTSYSMGVPDAITAAVPEPSAMVLVAMIGVVLIFKWRISA